MKRSTTVFLAAMLLIASSVYAARGTDPNATFDLTVTDITIVNNMKERDITIKYYTVSPSGTNYAGKNITSKNRVTKLSVCKAMGFYIRDNATHHEYDPAPSSPLISANNVQRFIPFCLNNHKFYHIPTKDVRLSPVYSLNPDDSCVGPI